MTTDTTSGFLNPEDLTSQWTEITLLQARKRNVLYRAKRYGRWFILKTLSNDCQDLTDYRLLQEREFQIGFSLHHPNIVETYSIEEVPAVGRCIVIEYVDGTTLAQWLATRPSYAARVRIWNQLTDVREYLESRQMEHHDLKADNILITRDGKYLKLIDFGLSGTESGRSDEQDLSRLYRMLFPNSLQRVWMRGAKWIGGIAVGISLLIIATCVAFMLVQREQITAYMRQERTLEEVSRRLDTEFALWDKAIEEAAPETLMEMFEVLNPLIQASWQTRDSFINCYPENDPLHYTIFDLWTQRSMEKQNAIQQRFVP
ncbi:MAG: protein kinase family protein [Paludibacteraceae bacterium]|nr:protein kinase family protein [Paludibacteraceae bacterium]